MDEVSARLNLRGQVGIIQKAGNAILEDLAKGMLSVEFTLAYLTKFMADGTLTKEDLFNFYHAEEIKDKYKALDVQAFLSDK